MRTRLCFVQRELANPACIARVIVTRRICYYVPFCEATSCPSILVDYSSMQRRLVERSAHPPRRRRQCPGIQVQAAPIVGAIVLASLGALLLTADVRIMPTGVGLRSSMGRRLAMSPPSRRSDTSAAPRRIQAPVPNPSRNDRRVSLALPDGDCVIRPALKPTRPLAPTFTASYPGSGAKMTWNLVQALTGIVTGDEHRHNQQSWSEAVTGK